jgi:hypothetical protein
MVLDECDFLTIPAASKAIGSPAGELLFADASSKIRNAVADESGLVVVIDFRKVTLATTSYVKAGLLALSLAGKRHGELTGTALDDSFGPTPLNIYPVFANLDSEVLDTIQEVYAGRGLPFVSAQLSDDRICDAQICGFLDEALARTMRLIRGREQVTALELAAEFPSEGIKPTGWNNRLNDLWRLRLLRRVKRGKAWWYKTINKELIYGR